MDSPHDVYNQQGLLKYLAFQRYLGQNIIQKRDSRLYCKSVRDVTIWIYFKLFFIFNKVVNNNIYAILTKMQI